MLPIHLNVATVLRNLHQAAEQLEGELGEEQDIFIEGCQRDWAGLPDPDPPLTVGIDGGYVHGRDGDNRKAGSFEVIAGKSMMAEGPAKCFAFVNGYDQKPKRRLFEMLTAQGLQMNQAITFLSDGGDTVRELQLYLSPQAEHLLDWFHPYNADNGHEADGQRDFPDGPGGPGSRDRAREMVPLARQRLSGIAGDRGSLLGP
ncbi:MAG: hypothetical protein HYW07_00915 [Candidatus Latescibacteria bacterium]|nr:hypothetical protein [Candidatus Latescibacterota bacterium]